MPTSIALVVAPRQQRGAVCRASDQFDVSPFFRRAREYCERHYDEWYILGAEHGVMLPRQVIGREERPLRDLAAEERAAWASLVAKDLRAQCARFAEPPNVVLFGSQRFAEALQRALPEIEIGQPLGGMELYRRLRWFDEQLRVRPRVLSVA